jgi:hypothetical protein
VLDLLVPEVRRADLAAGARLDPGEVTMAADDWYVGNDGKWHHTSDTLPPDPTVTAMMPTVAPPPRVPDVQDDLSHLDQAAGELVNTEKVGPLDEVLVQPPQDPEWRP